MRTADKAINGYRPKKLSVSQKQKFKMKFCNLKNKHEKQDNFLFNDNDCYNWTGLSPFK